MRCLNQAVIDVQKGNVVSDQPVSVKLTNGEINAKRMEVTEGGAVIQASPAAWSTSFVPAHDSSPRWRTKNEIPVCTCGLVAIARACMGGGTGPSCRRGSGRRCGPGRRRVRQSGAAGFRSSQRHLKSATKKKIATFSGDVQVVQGDMTIKCQTLVVFYGGGRNGGSPTVASATAGGANGSHRSPAQRA